MIKVCTIACVAFLLLSCSSNDNNIPKDILPKLKMQKVLWDLVTATEYLNGFVYTSDTSLNKTAEAVKWYDHVYKLNHTTRAEFEKSYAFYRDHPLLMKEMLDSLTHKKPPVFAPPAKDSIPSHDSSSKKKLLKPGMSVFPAIDTNRSHRIRPRR